MRDPLLPGLIPELLDHVVDPKGMHIIATSQRTMFADQHYPVNTLPWKSLTAWGLNQPASA